MLKKTKLATWRTTRNVGKLVAMLSDEDPDVSEAACDALEGLPVDSEVQYRIGLHGLKRKPFGYNWERAGERAVGMLIQSGKLEDPERRYEAAGLGLGSPNPDVRDWALGILVSIGKKEDAVKTITEELFHDQSRYPAQAVRRALDKLENELLHKRDGWPWLIYFPGFGRGEIAPDNPRDEATWRARAAPSFEWRFRPAAKKRVQAAILEEAAESFWNEQKGATTQAAEADECPPKRGQIRERPPWSEEEGRAWLREASTSEVARAISFDGRIGALSYKESWKLTLSEFGGVKGLTLFMLSGTTADDYIHDVLNGREALVADAIAQIGRDPSKRWVFKGFFLNAEMRTPYAYAKEILEGADKYLEKDKMVADRVAFLRQWYGDKGYYRGALEFFDEI